MNKDQPLEAIVSEDTIIGQCIMAPEESIFKLCESGIEPSWFIQPDAQKTFNVLLKMYIDGKEISMPTMLEYSNTKNLNVDISYVHRCVDLTPIRKELDVFIKPLREMHMRRKMVSHSLELKENAYEMSDEPEELIGKTICSLADLTVKHTKKSKEEIKKMIISRYMAAARGGTIGIPLPWPNISRNLGGLVPKQVTVFAGRGGIGKSQASATLVRHLGEIGIPVAYLPFEDGVERTWARLASIEGKYSSFRMDQGGSEAEVHIAEQYLTRVMDYPIYMEDRPMTAEQVMAWAIHHKVRNKIQVLVIDAFKDLRRRSRDVSEDDQMSQVICEIAKSLDIPVWVSHHVRKRDGIDNKRDKLTTDDIRGSANIVNDARQLIVAQNWLGEDGIERFSFDGLKNNNGPSGWSIPMTRVSAHNYWMEQEIKEETKE